MVALEKQSITLLKKRGVILRRKVAKIMLYLIQILKESNTTMTAENNLSQIRILFQT